MQRNFFRRVEVCFPVLEAKLKRRVIKEGLEPYLKDNCQTWEMDAEGNYRRKSPRSGSKIVCAQTQLMQELSQLKG
jgi:polyphosphate kinase